MKKLWETEIEILEVFKGICEKNGIRYFAAGGTLLGAVRHKGFIPWDDDIDIQLPPEDFARFCEVVQDELPDNYFFESYKTEEHFRPYHYKIRKVDTKAYTVKEKACNPNSAEGIWIDLFRMDYLPENAIARLWKIFRMKVLRVFYHGETNTRRMHRYKSRRKKLKLLLNPFTLAWLLVGRLFLSEKRMNDMYCRIAATKGPTGKLAATCFRPGSEKLIWDTSDFENTVELPFEYTTISAPQNYDKVLTQQYGNWHVFERGTEYHSRIVIPQDEEQDGPASDTAALENDAPAINSFNRFS